MRMKKQPKTNRTILSWKLISIVALVLLLVAWFAQVRVSQHYDGLRFAEADKKKQIVFDELLNKIDTPLKIEKKNICYDSEQGPWDNGRLWCQVTSAAYFVEATSEMQIREIFEAVVNNNALRKIETRANGTVFYGSEDLLCSLTVYDGLLAADPGFYLSDQRDSKQTVIVRCSDRAKAKHYPYIE